MAEKFDIIERIGSLTNNARTTWITLLGALLFVGVTLLDVKHVDFHGVNRDTQLPLVNVSVPTLYFFYVAPILIAMIYGYFHLYLIRLFDELGAAQQTQYAKPLGQTISPWLISDAALWLRRRLRDDTCSKGRPVEGLSAVFNFGIVWLFGPLVLWYSWYISLAARDF